MLTPTVVMVRSTFSANEGGGLLVHEKHKVMPRRVLSDQQIAANREIFEHALLSAQRIANHSCPMVGDAIATRVAPLMFDDMPDALMSAQALFVSRPGGEYDSTLERVWVPLSLAIERSKGQPELRASLIAVAAHDIFITVSTRHAFAVGDADCDWIDIEGAGAYYSATSVLLHELMHGLGIYSVLKENTADAINHQISVFDAQMTTGVGQTRIFNTQDDVDRVSGASLQGQTVEVVGYPLYNPDTFRPGSSLSHFAGPGLMFFSAKRNTCTLDMGHVDVAALNAVGWQCQERDGTYEWDSETHYFQAGTSNGLGQHTAYCPAGQCWNDRMAQCLGCSNSTSSDTVTLIFLIVCSALCAALAFLCAMRRWLASRKTDSYDQIAITNQDSEYIVRRA